MRYDLKHIVVCVILLCTPESLFSQTYITPQLGLSLHSQSFNGISDNVNYYESKDNKFDIGLGVNVKHNLTSKWFIGLEAMCYLKEHTYTFHSFGVNPRSDYFYRMANIEIATGLKIIKQLELGLGMRKLVLYNNTIKHTNGHIEDLSNSFYNAYLFFLSYSYNDLVIKVSYSNSIENKELMDIELVSFSVGYRMRIFNPTNRSKNVDCPKIYN